MDEPNTASPMRLITGTDSPAQAAMPHETYPAQKQRGSRWPHPSALIRPRRSLPTQHRHRPGCASRAAPASALSATTAAPPPTPPQATHLHEVAHLDEFYADLLFNDPAIRTGAQQQRGGWLQRHQGRERIRRVALRLRLRSASAHICQRARLRGAHYLQPLPHQHERYQQRRNFE
jgi:hypothetical protein